MVEDSGDRSLKTPTRVRIRVEGMEGPICRSWGSEMRISGIRNEAEAQAFACCVCV